VGVCGGGGLEVGGGAVMWGGGGGVGGGGEGGGVLLYTAQTGMFRWIGHGFLKFFLFVLNRAYNIARTFPKQGVQFRPNLS